LGRLDGRLAVNAGFLCGHSAIRRFVMGADAVGHPATRPQLDAMTALLHGAMDAGALGFSSSQTANHNDGDGQPIPSRAATRDELLTLAAAVASHPGTTLEWIFAGGVNGFSDDELDLMTALSLAADRPLNWNALGVSSDDPDGHWRKLDASTRAAQRGATVLALTVPHLLRLRLSLETGFIFDGLPGWAETMALPIPWRIAALRNPEVRQQLAEGAQSPEAGLLRNLVDWEGVAVVEVFTPDLQDAVGLTGAELARRRRAPSAFDALLDVAVADELRTGLAATTLGDDDATWKVRADVWRDSGVILGASDAGAHMDLMCGAEYSSIHLGANVRERRLLSLEDAVRQLTDLPASLYGLRHRGRVQEGWWGDLMVFDPDTIAAGPTHTRQDLPGGCSRLYCEAIGISHVLVNGTPIVTHGELTGSEPGTLLRSGRDTDTVRAGDWPAVVALRHDSSAR
jgi:N-acyl-D-aspartate/D-glutamate deacylase